VKSAATKISFGFFGLGHWGKGKQSTTERATHWGIFWKMEQREFPSKTFGE